MRLPHGNPLKRIKHPTPAPGRHQRLELGQEELLLQALDPEFRPAVILLIETACRRSELLGMQWPHVDLLKRSWLIPDSKNGVARTVPLSLRAVEVLQSLQMGKSLGKVFSIRPDRLTRRVRTALDSIGAAHVRLHDLRREGTSRFLELGMSASEASAITGHKSLSMLQRYTALRHQHLVAKLDAPASVRNMPSPQ